MNINTSIGLRDRSRITLSNFKGLDTLSAAVDVSAIHATDMKNLISRDEGGCRGSTEFLNFHGKIQKTSLTSFI